MADAIHFYVGFFLFTTIGFGLVYAAVVGPTIIHRIGRGYCTDDAETIIAENKFPPVLYLRPFGHDTDTRAFRHAFLKSDEECLAEALGVAGPVIAIAQPGRKMPDAGAARLYISDSEWQTRVRNLIKSSRLVVCRLGSSPGLMWELNETKSLLHHSQLILIVPLHESFPYSAIRITLMDDLDIELPDLEKGGNLPQGKGPELTSILGFIHFDEEWKGKIELPRYSFRNYFETSFGSLWSALFLDALRPALQKAGVEYKKPR